ncbi:uncharacterized protein OCT59_007417 [Rhizophagus irregularis]|uniref:uncharacterized protein n=1 Tax=Rhizophagus irregularis TaxID=588596 RepID=UPI00331CADC7|nr:hypothetical protein OCT59_007417 [Rhizophagus irregularis]
MTKRRGVTGKDKATKAAKTTKTIRTYVANSSRDYNKERDERREEGSEQDVDIGEGNNRQDDDIERIILDMLPEQEERNIEKERRENEKKEMERRDKERREKERREKERRERNRREKDKEQEKNENDEKSEEEILVQFGAMTNQLQICNWLVLHPSVLHLANKMLDVSTKQPSTNLLLTTLTSSSSDNIKSISYFGCYILTN